MKGISEIDMNSNKDMIILTRINNYLIHNLKIFLLLIIPLMLIIFSSFISADIISINAGGSKNLSVSTDRYIEGFFFGIPEEVAPLPPPPSPPPSTGPVEIPQLVSISVSPTQFNINLIVNTTTERIIKVTNLGNSTITIPISQLDLNNRVILPVNNLTIQPGQTQDLKVIFVALSEPGIFTGKIIIDAKEVLVSLNVKTRLLIFDSNIVVLNKDFKVVQGEELRTLVTLIPLGEPERLDVTLNFVIKDYRNRVYLTKSETMMIENQVQLRRNFDTGTLSPGEYIVGLELVYPNGIAPSSAHFIVIEKPKPPLIGRILLFLIIMIIVVIILIIIVLILRRRKKKEEQQTQEQLT